MKKLISFKELDLVYNKCHECIKDEINIGRCKPKDCAIWKDLEKGVT